MPTINLNREEFERLVGKKLPIEKLKDRISMLGTDLEDINNKEIIVEVFPDRPDMLSEQGFARAFSAFIGHKVGLRRYNARKSGEKVIVDASVKEARPCTACAIVKNLKLTDEKIKQIMQLQEKLHITFGRNRKKAAIGVYPLERIKMPVYFRGMKPTEIKFKPLDFNRELNGLEILTLHPKGVEFAHLLEGKKVFPVFVDSAGKILSMPPIINSDDTGRVDENTREVFIECSGFDLNVLKQCLNIIVTAFADIGGEVYSIEVHDKRKEITPNLEPWKMKLDIGYVNKTLGLQLKETEIKKLLGRMGLGYENKNVLIPPYRADIIHQVDVIEDIAIAYGYENFKEEIPNISTIAEQDKKQELKDKIAELLSGLGLLEVSTYSLTNKEESKKALVSAESVELANALNQDYNILKSNLLPSILKVLSENRHNDYPQKIFEIATVFSHGISETGISEREHLCIGVTSANANFTEVKQILDALTSLLCVKYTLDEKEIPSYISGRAGEIKSKGEHLGSLGEVNPEALNNFNLDYPVAVVNIDLDALIKGLEPK